MSELVLQSVLLVFKRRMFSELHDMKDDLGILKANTFRSSGQPTECPFPLPIANENNLEAAEDKLCNRTQRRIFVSVHAIIFIKV